MKHQPIVNPHARIGQIVKKTKAEEKDDLINTTKVQVLEKYGQSKKTTKAKTYNTMGVVAGGEDKDGGYQLEEKVDKRSVGVRLLSEGFMQAFIDFFYLTNGTTPSFIEPSEQMLNDQKLKKNVPQTMEQDKETLMYVEEQLQNGETRWREGKEKDAFKIYQGMAHRFETYNDYPTASYFYKRCLDISTEFNYSEGKALAFRGLGIAEEKVFNKYKAEEHLETAKETAVESGHTQNELMISKDLVRVYKLIADENLDVVRKYMTQSGPLAAADEDQKLFALDRAREYYQKCLDLSTEKGFKSKQAECHQRLGQIYEINGDLDAAIEARKSFLKITKEDSS